jgi:hypothetical protein
MHQGRKKLRFPVGTVAQRKQTATVTEVSDLYGFCPLRGVPWSSIAYLSGFVNAQQ